MKLTTALLAAAVLAGPALAQPKPRAVGPPANLKETTVQAWLKANINAFGFAYALADDLGAYYVQPALNQLDAPQHRRVWLRRVRFSATADGERETMVLYEFDCAEGRRRLLAADTYGGLNLTEPMKTGDFDTDRKGDAQWVYPRLQSVGEGLLIHACALKTGPWAPVKASAP